MRHAATTSLRLCGNECGGEDEAEETEAGQAPGIEPQGAVQDREEGDADENLVLGDGLLVALLGLGELAEDVHGGVEEDAREEERELEEEPEGRGSEEEAGGGEGEAVALVEGDIAVGKLEEMEG
ncbi:hypothetical protein BC938DRAFT_478532 [Jimgerdemannia flammicorona]|uniref:Uncharacterized protein n=1 Tax=Jimgerdemannia flammicorona TaxID=994334 RepID=A0A433QYD1_9FUNG|nr:hypothetical protein BC938DRAFT_478532 [Jimgerdemannia flammicorona]